MGKYKIHYMNKFIEPLGYLCFMGGCARCARYVGVCVCVGGWVQEVFVLNSLHTDSTRNRIRDMINPDGYHIT